MLKQQLQEDLAVAFRDWGENVVYRVVSTAVELDSQQVTETYEDTELTGLWGTAVADRFSAAAGQATAAGRLLVVRAVDLPEDAPQLTDRVWLEERVWRVVGFRWDHRHELLTLQLED